jgi:hypothetical protein
MAPDLYGDEEQSFGVPCHSVDPWFILDHEP